MDGGNGFDTTNLSVVEHSEVDKEAIERYKFLQRGERVGQFLLAMISKELSTINAFLEASEPNPLLTIRAWQRVVCDGGALSGSIREDVEEALPLQEIDSEVKARESVRTDIRVILKRLKSKGIENEAGEKEWLTALQAEPGLLNSIHSAMARIEATDARIAVVTDAFINRLRDTYHTRSTSIVSFKSFFTDIIPELPEESYKTIMELTKDKIDLGREPDEYDPVVFSKLCDADKRTNEAINELKAASHGIIKKRMEDCRDIIRSYKDLATKYSEAIEKTEGDFESLMGELKNTEMQLLKGAEGSIRLMDSLTFVRDVVDEPESKRDYYRKRALDLTKKNLSKRYKRIHEEATREIANASLFTWLLAVKEDQGAKELQSRLEVLREMERSGILTFH
jgi:hypothetical protein